MRGGLTGAREPGSRKAVLRALAQYDRLHVLGISFGLGGSDPATNAAIARKGRGRYLYITAFDDLPLAISRILAGRG